MPSNLLLSLFCVIGLLAFATILVFILRWARPNHETIGKVGVIVKSWWYIAVPFLAALYLGARALMILFFVVSCLAMRELIRFSRFESLRKPLVLFVCLVDARFSAADTK